MKDEKRRRRQVMIDGITRKEAKLIERALQETDVRAFVFVVGALSALPTKRAKQRVLRYTADAMEEVMRDA